MTLAIILLIFIFHIRPCVDQFLCALISASSNSLPRDIINHSKQALCGFLLGVRIEAKDEVAVNGHPSCCDFNIISVLF